MMDTESGMEAAASITWIPDPPRYATLDHDMQPSHVTITCRGDKCLGVPASTSGDVPMQRPATERPHATVVGPSPMQGPVLMRCHDLDYNVPQAQVVPEQFNQLGYRDRKSVV
jgi:hypothetical protein